MASFSDTEYFHDLDLLQSVINSLKEGVVLQNREGRVVGCNDQACRILQLEPGQLLGKTSQDPIWHVVGFNGAAVPIDQRPIFQTFETGKPLNDVVMGLDTGVMIKWLSVSTKLINVANEKLAFATFTDISELVNANIRLQKEKEKLKASEEKFEQSFRASAIPKAIVSTRGVFIDINNAFCKMLGYTKEELIGKTFSDITYPEDLSKDITLFQNLLTRKIETYQLEKRYFHKDGSILWGFLNVAPVWGDDGQQPRFVLAQVQEITETKKLNKWLEERNNELLKTQSQLRRKIGQLRDFAGIITHDVRGPAANIKRMLELYESAADNDTRETAFQYLKKVSTELTGNLNELIEVLRIHMDDEIPSSNCDFEALTNNIVFQLEELIRQKNAQVITAFTVKNIYYPKAYLQSILYNLIGNSLKFTREGIPPLIRVYTYQKDGHTHLSVEDNGLGINLGRFGKVLFQFQKSFHEGFDSKGIGLYIVKNQVEDLGGSISVESEVNKGTIFTIRF